MVYDPRREAGAAACVCPVPTRQDAPDARSRLGGITGGSHQTDRLARFLRQHTDLKHHPAPFPHADM
jgi:hypothetical protein